MWHSGEPHLLVVKPDEGEEALEALLHGDVLQGVLVLGDGGLILLDTINQRSKKKQYFGGKNDKNYLFLADKKRSKFSYLKKKKIFVKVKSSRISLHWFKLFLL